MSKSLSQLFGMLANAGAPRSAEEYKASLNGVRAKLANSLPANEQEKVKQNDAMMGVDGQGRTPLGKIFAKEKIQNGGEGSGIKGHTTGLTYTGQHNEIVRAPHHTDHPPISNVQGGWEYHAPTETYSSESSQLEHSGRHDPWGRPLIMRYLKQHDDEGDVTHWSGTIQAPPAQMGTLGKAAKIQIFND